MAEETAPNSKRIPGVAFTKDDPRINRNGRPKNAKGLRKLARDIMREVVTSKDGKLELSRLELILKDWSSSRDFRKQQALVETGYGKLAQPIDLKLSGTLTVEDARNLSDAELAELIKQSGG